MTGSIGSTGSTGSTGTAKAAKAAKAASAADARNAVPAAVRTVARFDLPESDAFTRPYWDAAAEGRLLLRRCRAEGCGAAHHYPREFCPYCWSENVGWEPASGRATLYTWSVVHRNDLPPFGDRVPYTAAVVDLAEGPRMMTEIIDCPEPALRIGMPLVVHFRSAGATGAADDGGFALPVFRPA
nr:OB-fold domain-containing protein [Streptomyces sioyaensis]